MTKQESEAVEYLLDTFDFQQVHSYMELTKWKWAGYPCTPSVDALKSAARRLLETVLQAKDPKHGFTATGGFAARLDGWENSKPQLSLLFYVQSISTTIEG